MEINLKNQQEVNIWGRCGSDGEALVLFWPGSGPEIRFRGSMVKAVLEAEYGNLELWLDVIVNGERLSRFPLEKGKKEYVLVRGLDPAKENVIRISRNTQNMPEDTVSLIRIHRVEVEGEVLTPPSYPYQLEFIGDSITSGEGCGLTSLEEWIPAVFDNWETYSRYTAEQLKAQYNVISQSGWGVYAAWDGNTEGNIPDVFPCLCGSQKNERAKGLGSLQDWDFASHQKDAVIINLGTNDSGAISTKKWTREEYAVLFREKMTGFIKTLRNCYPEAHLVWAYGMLGQDMQDLIREIIGTYMEETGDKKISFFLMPDSAPEHLGVRYHPTPEAHRIAAGELVQYLKTLL